MSIDDLICRKAERQSTACACRLFESAQASPSAIELRKPSWLFLTRVVIFSALLTVSMVGRARADSCSTTVAEQAVLAAFKIVESLGVKAAKEVITVKDARFRCGAFSVKVIDHHATWVIDPENETNVGRNVTSFNDGAATNFMNSLVRHAIGNRGTMGSHFTTDTEKGKKINKALYYIDVPKHKVVVYGAFILD
ncbi:MAG: hypothetical protein HQL65_17445 [Magnetococcales bacterium]|nr:hypothetical protein [Magnetococcales bacterium]